MSNLIPVAEHSVGAAENGDHPQPAEIVITGSSGWHLPDIHDLWQYRDLFAFLAWRDVKVRYKQSVLGAAWAIIQPVAMMLVFTAVLGRISNRSSGDIPYPVFVYAGLLPWTLFATGLNSAANSIVGSERLITKVFFPRLIIPFAAVGHAILDFFVALAILIILMLWYRVPPSWSLLLAPLPILLLVVASLAAGTILAAFNVLYRDFRHALPFLIQIWMLATPSIYLPPVTDEHPDANRAAAVAKDDASTSGDTTTSTTTPVTPHSESATMKFLKLANPPLGLISFFRACVLGTELPWSALIAPAIVSLVGLLVACMVFQRLEDTFADVI